MPEVISIKGQRPDVIFNARDFEELIDKHMGMGCAKYYRSQIEQLSDCIRELTAYVNDKDVQADMEEVLRINGY